MAHEDEVGLQPSFDRLLRGRVDVLLAVSESLATGGSRKTRSGSVAAEERARLDKEGMPVPFVDGQIAAIAKSNDLILVTVNVRDFQRHSHALTCRVLHPLHCPRASLSAASSEVGGVAGALMRPVRALSSEKRPLLCMYTTPLVVSAPVGFE